MRRVLVILGSLAVLVLTVRARVMMEPGLDYETDASDAIDALVRRDWDGFVAMQPLMGSFSLLLRAPFVATVFHGHLDTVYYVGALPCVLATAALGVFLGRMAASHGHGIAVQGLVGGLAVLNPMTFRALHWGHPEELLGAALCVGAVLAVLRDREILGAVMLGLALATKQWAVLAVAPVLLAGPRRPVLVAMIAGAIATALTLPMLLGNSESFGQVAQSASGQVAAARSTTPWNIWWPLAELGVMPGRGERFFSPGWVPAISHPLIVLMALPLGLALRRRADRRRDDALLLLAVLLLLRCVLDNWNNEYYHLPFLLALLSWETMRRPGVPRLTLAVTLLLGLTFWPQHFAMFADSAATAGTFFALYVAWAVPLTIGLGTALLAPQRLPQLVSGPRPRVAAPAVR